MQVQVSANVEVNPSSIYAAMLEVKANDGRRGCFIIKKSECKSANVAWSFVESSAAILGLRIERNGVWGYVISV